EPPGRIGVAVPDTDPFELHCRFGVVSIVEHGGDEHEGVDAGPAPIACHERGRSSEPPSRACPDNDDAALSAAEFRCLRLYPFEAGVAVRDWCGVWMLGCESIVDRDD